MATIKVPKFDATLLKTLLSPQTLAGPLAVPAGATGAQVPQRQEVDQAIASASTQDRARENHTGTQTASTISDFDTAAQAVAGPVADAAIAEHIASLDPHSQYTTDAEAAAIAASSVLAHTNEADPHPQYSTSTEVQAAVDAHANRTDNPHATTAEQVGAQPVNATLTEIAGVTIAPDTSIYFDALGDALTYSITAFGRNFVGSADAIAARTALGLGTIATQSANAVAITGGSITGLTAQVTVTPLNNVATPEYSFVADGNTGVRRSSADNLNLVTNGGDAVRVDSSQRTLLSSAVGFSTNNVSSVTIGGASGRLQVFDFGGALNNIQVLQYVNAVTAGKLVAAKSRSAIVGTFLTVNNNDVLFDFDGYGDDGASFQNCVKIRMDVSGTPAAGSVPGRLRIQTGNSVGTLADSLVCTPQQRTLFGTLTDDGVNRLQVNGAATVSDSYKVANNIVITSARHFQNRSYTLATLPSAAANSAQDIFISDFGSGSKATSDGSTWKAASETIFSGTANQSVTNTAAETTLFSAGSGSKSIPANFRRVGQTIQYINSGAFSAVSGSVLTIRVKLGAVTLATAVINDLSTLVDQAFHIDTLITTRTTGATGTVVCSGVFRYRATSGGKGHADLMSGLTPVIVDSTVSNALEITAQWDTATATRSIVSTNSNINIKN